VAWLAAAVAGGPVIGVFTPIGIALSVPLEYRFAFSPSDSQAPPDGIILLGGATIDGLKAVSALSQNYPKAVMANAINAPRRRDDRAGATQSMYRLSTVSANQLSFAIGKTDSKRTTNPIITSGIVMASKTEPARCSSSLSASNSPGAPTIFLDPGFTLLWIAEEMREEHFRRT
jgi:hypothetical protein